MATSINTIKNWFKTGMFPTQAQFWAWIDSFRHKDDKVPVADIEGLNELLDLKADSEQVTAELALKADKTYVDNLVTGLWDDRGSYDASTNLFPSTDGSGTDGAILKGDIWTISVAGTLGDEVVQVGDTVRALVDSPSDTPSNWSILQNNIGYVPLNYDIDNYPGVTLPLVNTDKILINRSGGWKKLAWVDILNTIKTYLLGGEIQLPAYISSRNDGANPSNKVLSTDVNGNLKLYSIATAPAPFIAELIPDSYLPDTTGNIRIYGDFFVPTMCDRVNNPNAIVLGGVTTIHYATFISSQEILINVTTGSAEGNFSCTLNNGLSTTKNNALLIVLGTVYSPIESDWENISGSIDLSQEKSAKVLVYNTFGVARLQQPKFTINAPNFRLYCQLSHSPLGNTGNDIYYDVLRLKKVSDNSLVYSFQMYTNGPNFTIFRVMSQGSEVVRVENQGQPNFYIQRKDGVVTVFRNGALFHVLSLVEVSDMYIEFGVQISDIVDIKYIELT